MRVLFRLERLNLFYSEYPVFCCNNSLTFFYFKFVLLPIDAKEDFRISSKVQILIRMIGLDYITQLAGFIFAYDS